MFQVYQLILFRRTSQCPKCPSFLNLSHLTENAYKTKTTPVEFLIITEKGLEKKQAEMMHCHTTGSALASWLQRASEPHTKNRIPSLCLLIYKKDTRHTLIDPEKDWTIILLSLSAMNAHWKCKWTFFSLTCSPRTPSVSLLVFNCGFFYFFGGSFRGR